MHMISGVRVSVNFLNSLLLAILLMSQSAQAGGLFLTEIGTPDVGLAGAGMGCPGAGCFDLVQESGRDDIIGWGSISRWRTTIVWQYWIHVCTAIPPRPAEEAEIP